MSRKSADLLVLLTIFVLGLLYSQLTRGLFVGKPLFVSLITILPMVGYLGFREKKRWDKILAAALVFGLLVGFGFEFVQEFNKSYRVMVSVFPRILGVVPLDNVLGHMLMTFLTITFYQHFIREIHGTPISKRVLIFALAVLIGVVIELSLFHLSPQRLRLAYPYFYVGIIAVTPVLFLGLRKPEFIVKMGQMVPFFFFLYLITEMIAIKGSWWVYPGDNYVGWISLAGLRFPFEELFFWMLFYAPTLVSYYELMIENS